MNFLMIFLKSQQMFAIVLFIGFRGRPTEIGEYWLLRCWNPTDFDSSKLNIVAPQKFSAEKVKKKNLKNGPD